MDGLPRSWKRAPDAASAPRHAISIKLPATPTLKTALRIEQRISDEELVDWSKLVYEACTVCNKCAMSCPMGIQLGPLIHDVRTGLAVTRWHLVNPSQSRPRLPRAMSN